MKFSLYFGTVGRCVGTEIVIFERPPTAALVDTVIAI